MIQNGNFQKARVADTSAHAVPRKNTRHRVRIFWEYSYKPQKAVFTILLEMKAEYDKMMIKVRKRKIQEEEKMAEIYDIAILGAGPAGISAAIYAARARLNTLWLDRQFAQGGQILNTYEVDNYPGLPGISGMDLGEAMGDHAAKLGIEPVRENVLSGENGRRFRK